MALFRGTCRFLSSSVAKTIAEPFSRRVPVPRHLSALALQRNSCRGELQVQFSVRQQLIGSPLRLSVRNYSDAEIEDEWYNVGFEALNDHIKKEDILLVDVREPSEVQTYGFIPTSVNIPVKELDDTFSMSPEMFQARFGRRLPSKDGREIVFHCMGGVRSRRALQLAWDKGYSKARHFPGGFEAWDELTNQK